MVEDCYSDEEPSLDFNPLTAQEAQALRITLHVLSPWWVIAAQVLVSALATGVTAVFWDGSTSRSVACGGLAVALPSLLFDRGIMGRVGAYPAVFRFFIWESVKIFATVAVLYSAHRWVDHLSWPAMLVGLVVTMKVYWLALVFHHPIRAKIIAYGHPTSLKTSLKISLKVT